MMMQSVFTTIPITEKGRLTVLGDHQTLPTKHTSWTQMTLVKTHGLQKKVHIK